MSRQGFWGRNKGLRYGTVKSVQTTPPNSPRERPTAAAGPGNHAYQGVTGSTAASRARSPCAARRLCCSPHCSASQRPDHIRIRQPLVWSRSSLPFSLPSSLPTQKPGRPVFSLPFLFFSHLLPPLLFSSLYLSLYPSSSLSFLTSPPALLLINPTSGGKHRASSALAARAPSSLLLCLLA